MLNFMSAKAAIGVTDVASTTAADTAALVTAAAMADASQAATRPLVGIGAGAFACAGPQAGLVRTGTTVSLSLPRLRRAGATSGTGSAVAGLAHEGPGTTGITTVSRTVKTEQFNFMTHRYPVALGALGPHPAREPEPV